ncbi:MAG: Bax inhibitor-1/YccA family protein, partial [Pseudomonadota bacterium]
MNDLRTEYGQPQSRAGVAVDEGLRQYMLGVYNYMAIAVAATGAMSLFIAGNQAMISMIAGTPLRWVVFAGILGVGWFGPKVIMSGSRPMAHVMFWLYAGLWGLLIAPWLYVFQQADAAQEIYRAFFITATVFGAMSLWGYTTKRNLMGWSSFLFMATLGLLVAIILNAVFFKSGMMSLITSCAVVLVFSAVTAFETQAIRKMYRQGSDTNERASIFGAFMLYGSFATLFIHILNILGMARE